MPLIRCDKDGQRGWKWGEGGTCFLTREDAIEQGRAIEAKKGLQDDKPKRSKIEICDTTRD